ncbi:hypothetical protein M0R45_005329 [Rubus argutus]|uniref:Uncharacterized protein n=1 Tax=Rubus argutus TaxID=59490 RepID=A0AAW1YMA9_RUBAR
MSLNSQMFHIVINGCQDVHIQSVKVIAAGNSPTPTASMSNYQEMLLSSTPPSKLGTIVSRLAPAPRTYGWNASHADLVTALA